MTLQQALPGSFVIGAVGGDLAANFWDESGDRFSGAVDWGGGSMPHLLKRCN